MSEKNNIDKLFRDNLSNDEFDFNPEAWNKMEQMIIDQERKKRFAWFWWVGGAAAILAIVFSLNHITTESTKEPIAQVVLQDTSVVKSKEVKEDTVQESNQLEKTTAEIKNNSDQQAIEKQDIDNQIVKKETTVDSDEPDEEVTLSKNEIKSSIPVIVAEDDYVDTNIIANQEETEKEISIKEKIQLIKQQRTEEKLALMEYRIAQLKVNEDNHAKLRDIAVDRMNWLRKININIIAGTSISQGFLNQNLSRANPSLDPVVGLGTSVVVNSLVSLDINALYSNRRGLSQEKLPEAYVETGTTEIAKSLHYIDIPFYINYRFKNRHAVRFGLQYSSLLGTVSDVITTTTTTTWKKQNYFASYDVAGIVGYKYLVNERFNVGVRGNFGLFDVTLGQPAQSNTFDMNRQVRFLIEYKLLKY